MCVIAVSETVRLKSDQVEKMYEHNPAGGGVAWRDTIQEKGKTIKIVRWKKGLSKEEMVELCKELPLPFAAHFRIPTVGGPKKALCHPFPITKDVDLDLEGKSKEYVLFHNGHWGRWKEFSLDSAAKHGFKVPTGKWSDSRAMAWAAALHGLGVLEFIDEKAIAFGPEDIQVFGGGNTHSSWTLIDSGIYVSNTSWQYTTHGYGHNNHSAYSKGVCMFGTCKKDRTNGTKYCEDHPDGKEKVAGFLPAKKDDETTGTLSSDGVRGGGSNLTPFRSVQGSGSAVPEGQAESQEVEEGATGDAGVRTTSVGKHGKEGERAVSETRKAVSPEEAESFRWASGLNPKRYRTGDGRRLVDPRVTTVN